jgi:hypothetical protein
LLIGHLPETVNELIDAGGLEGSLQTKDTFGGEQVPQARFEGLKDYPI